MSVRPLLSEIVALKRLHYVDRPSNINLGIIICSFEVFQALQPFPAICSYGTEYTILIDLMTVFDQGRSQDFLKAGGHIQRVLTRLSPKYCLLFAYKKAYKGGSRALQDPPGYALVFDAILLDRESGQKLQCSIWEWEFLRIEFYTICELQRCNTR